MLRVNAESPKKRVAIRLEEALIEQLTALAKRNERTLTAEVRRALRKHLADEQLERAA